MFNNTLVRHVNYPDSVGYAYEGSEEYDEYGGLIQDNTDFQMVLWYCGTPDADETLIEYENNLIQIPFTEQGDKFVENGYGLEWYKLPWSDVGTSCWAKDPTLLEKLITKHMAYELSDGNIFTAKTNGLLMKYEMDYVKPIKMWYMRLIQLKDDHRGINDIYNGKVIRTKEL